MSKYVIELQPNCKIVQQICESDGQLSIHTKWVDYLKELNSDYINEHFGDMQDETYQRGLDDAWEAARKIIEMTDPPYWEVFNEYKDDLFGKITASEAIAKLKAYEENQDDKFEFGDEIIDVDGMKGCVVSKNNEEYDTMYVLFNGCRVPQYVIKSYYRKTGRHFDIDKILEEMKE